MSTALAVRSTAGARPGVLAVLRLQHVKRFETYGTPLLVMGSAAVLTGLVALVVWRATDGAEPVAEVSGSTSIVLWWLVGYMGYNGVQSVATTFPLALSLGATRAAFTAGTLLHHVRVAAFVAVAALLLLGLERLTGQWFVGLHLFGGDQLGGGDPVRLVVTLFLAVLTVLSLGGAFAAVWVRAGARATGIAGMVLGLCLGLAAVFLVPLVLPLVGAFEVWWLAVVALLVIAASAVVELVALRRASVR